jgi:membrane protease subunit HflK
MTESATSPDRRAQLTAIVGAILQVVFFAVLAIVGAVNQSDAVLAVSYWMLGGVVIWPVLALLYGQRHRMREERRQAEELKRSREAEGVSAIFDAEDETYLIERRRLNWMLRWLLPSAVVLVAGYHIARGIWGWHWEWGVSLRDEVWRLADRRGVTMTFVGGVGFLAFLFSRYTAGMARMSGWRMLRAGASYLAGNALACLVVLIAIGVQSSDFPIAEAAATYAIRAVIVLLGIEFFVNFALDFYRPRTAGEESRPAFDSRLLALITEPGGIARSLADAINYQFGFEVSGTWFYQLLKRALLPMCAFGVIALFALSSVLIVDADEEAVIERFGRRLQEPGEALTSGLYFKAPWPIDIAHTARVDQIRAFTVGDSPTKEQDEYEEFEGRKRHKPILWGEKHEFNAEMMLVLASSDRDEVSATTPVGELEVGEDRTAAAAMLKISVDIQYCVSDLHGYLYRYLEPEHVVENLAYQVLTDFAAGVTEDQFLGPGRTQVNAILSDALQRRLDEEGLGIKIVFVALQEAHPNDDVAKVYQEVVKAEIAKEAAIENARKEADTVLTQVAGSRSRALALDAAIVERDRLSQDPAADPAELAAARQRVRDLLLGNPADGVAPSGGESAWRIAQARAAVMADLTEKRRDLALFQAEVVAYETAPQLYRVRKYLDMLERATRNVRKYVVVVDPDKRVIIEYEREDDGTIELEELEM